MKKLVPKTININGQQESRLYGAARYENLEFTAAALGESIWQLNRSLFSQIQIEYYDTVTGARVGQVVGRSKHTLRGMLEEVSPEAMDPTGDNAAPFMIHVTYEKQEVKLPTGNLTLINAPIIPVLELEPALYRTVINGVNVTEELAIALGYV